MAPVFFQKPETALKRAQELISVGKELDALETLHDTIKSKRHKQWTKTHEQIMLKHLELCVNLRKAHVGKDALFQYKTLTQQVSTKSLETVTLFYLQLARQKTEEAQKTSQERVEEIDDLEMADAPESLLLSAVSGAAAQDRMDRTVLSPWLRFLWESYRNCLDLLRNNAVFEQLYHSIAKQSFEFCVKYQRRTEFRKLCDHMRIHLVQIQKHQHLPHVVKLTSAESLTTMQDTRLFQLDTAMQMELWQEAYRSAEDVHGMMQLSKDKDKRMVKPASYVNYYDKLALVFWKAGNRLYHATALLQKFIIYKDMKKMFTIEEASDQATRVLLATLSISDGADAPSDLTRYLDIEEQHISNIRTLSNLLRLPIAPTRNGILKEIARLNLPEIANENAKNICRLLEGDFSPIRLASKVLAELKKIKELQKSEYDQYSSALLSVTAAKILKRFSSMYDTLPISRVHEMIPFYDEIALERFIVDLCKHRYVRARIDHRGKCVHFTTADATLASDFDADVPDGMTEEFAQSSIDGLRGYLQSLFRGLFDVVRKLDAEKIRATAMERMKRHAEVYMYHMDNDYQRMLMRRRKIELYKETSERMKLERNQLAQAEASRREELRRAEEMRRLEQENIEKEKMRRQAEHEEIERRVRAEKIKRLQATPMYQAIVKDHGEEAFQNMDPDSVLREQRDRLDEQRREQQARLQLQEKKFDHMVRAYHLEEIVERKKISDEYAINAPIEYEKYEKKRIKAEIEAHEKALAFYERMQKLNLDAALFLKDMYIKYEGEFNRKMKTWEEALDTERKLCMAQRHEDRKRFRRATWLSMRDLESKKAKEAAEQALREEIENERRIARDAYRQGKREPQVESVADSDMDWRRGAQPPTVKQSNSISGFRQQVFGRLQENERQRDNRIVVNADPSDADNGPWIRGQVVEHVKSRDWPINYSEKTAASPYHVMSRERESDAAGESSSDSWRRSTNVKRDNNFNAGSVDRRTEFTNTVVSQPTAIDTNTWRRGQVVALQTPKDDGVQSSSPAALPSANLSWRQRPRAADNSDTFAVGAQQGGHSVGGSGDDQASVDESDKWNQVSHRNPARQIFTNQGRNVNDDTNWRKR